MKHRSEKEIHLRGVSVCKGIAIGPLVCIDEGERVVPEFTITAAEVEREIERFTKALDNSKQDLTTIKDSLEDTNSEEAVSIIQAHIQLLDDPVLRETVEMQIREVKKNTESVFRSVIQEVENQFAGLEDEYFAQRAADVRDLSQRVLRKLSPQEALATLRTRSIFYADELKPSHAVEGIKASTPAFISRKGGSTSHAALIAKSKGIPYVSDIELPELSEQCFVIVDGTEGVVILNPKEETIVLYEERRRSTIDEGVHDVNVPQLKSGECISLMANVNSYECVDEAVRYGVKMVGLYRTEYVSIGEGCKPDDEEAQYAYYKRIVENFPMVPIMYRVFDFGSDKMWDGAPKLREQNPALGIRALRYLFAHPDIFRAQVRALFRAHSDTVVNILFPMVADVEEFRKARDFVESIKEELEEPPVFVAYGAMIELPSAAILVEDLAKEAAFLSIGSNDLIQYTLGVDRCNEAVQNLYDELHPSVMILLARIVQAGDRYKTPVSLCGELASNPSYIKQLVGLGLRRFSCAPKDIAPIKRELARFTLEEAESSIPEEIATSRPENLTMVKLST